MKKKNLVIILNDGNRGLLKKNSLLRLMSEGISDLEIPFIRFINMESNDKWLSNKIKELKEENNCIIISTATNLTKAKVVVSSPLSDSPELYGVIDKAGKETVIQVSVNNPYYPKENVTFMEDWKKIQLMKYQEYTDYSFFNTASVKELLEIIKNKFYGIIEESGSN